ncbi:MAG TPA: ammonium transporter [Methanomassiliicoccales archaeon]|nr:ammonium transporter [Methanomassiliicoccales archaeon]
MRRYSVFLLLLLGLLVLLPATTMAADPSGAGNPIDLEGAMNSIDYVWVLVCAFLVFFMQAGFAMVEVGMVRVKNVANVLMKNFMDFTIGTIAFLIIGYSLLMGSDVGGIFGDPSSNFMLFGESYDAGNMLLWFFMLVFAATSVTIVSGAIAERPKFKTYLIYSAVVTAVIYPIYGHWIWGGGWLAASDFMVNLGGGYGALDFAGSGVVHALGGLLALAACIVIGPRIGKYTKEGKPLPIPGHNMTMVMLGGFILWFGWFGFNAGSTLSGNQLIIAKICVTTVIAGAVGAVTAVLLSWKRAGTPDLGLAVNGMLGGLVGITAGCAWVEPWAAMVIGAVSGIVVCYGVWFLEKKGVDDVVGAISVHGFNGLWGLIALGLFADGTFGVYTVDGPLVTGLLYGNAGFFAAQMINVVVLAIYALGTGFALFYGLKKTVGIRVSPEEELQGLDISEHNVSAYPEMVTKEVAMTQEAIK